jgi:hypothetical protein
MELNFINGQEKLNITKSTTANTGFTLLRVLGLI